MKKKAFVFGKPFVLILAIMIILFILIIGFKFIQGTLLVQADVEMISFQRNLQSTITHYTIVDPGSFTKTSFPIDENIQFICFVDREKELNLDNVPDESTKFLIESNLDKNVFPIPYPTKKAFNSFLIGGFSVEENPLCIRTINKLDITITSESYKAILTK